MKASRAFLIWSILTLCGLMVLGAMVWLTRGTLASEKSRAEAEARADLEECTRLALWRLDAAGAAVVAGENRHPPADYESGSQAFASTTDPLAKMHFELRENGKMVSPEAGADRTKLAPLRALLATNPLPGDEWSALICTAENSEASWNAVSKDAIQEKSDNVVQRQARAGNRADMTYQQNFNSVEKAQRAKNVEESILNSGTSAAWSQTAIESKKAMPRKEETSKATPQKGPPPQAQVQPEKQPEVYPFPGSVTPPPPAFIEPQVKELGQMRAAWIGGELLLLRQFTTVTGRTIEKGVQGVWLDHSLLKQRLLAEVKDLLPNADLAAADQATGNPLELVSFPFLLIRNEALPRMDARLTAPLLIGWAAVIIAILIATFLVHGIMKLSERRASFVSAVTHELRTPLTTFRLYSDMLESGAVKQEKRGEYLRVLSREADRLAHLVENVLSFSRIERGSARSVVREANVRELLEGMRERLEARLASAGLRLEMQNLSDARVRVDTAAVEHILFNLIDNAAKYAASGTPPVVTLQTAVNGRQVEIRVSDHGPGIPRDERGRIFRAFHKSAREAAESCPGVGLGLALSRRLAKSLGGGLDCVDSPHGACFILRLPLAD